MHKHNPLFAKCASGILSFSLIMSMIPSVPAWAEEDFSDDEYVEEETLAGADAEAAEELPSVFYITKFTDFEKDEEGHFTNEQTKEKYGDLKSEPGTSLEDLGLPEDLKVEGYWEADGSDVTSSITLENIIWKLKSDTDEEYTEASPEGTYTFVPDYEAYAMEYEDLDAVVPADGVKDLTINVQIVSAESEETEASPETEAETSLESEAETEAFSESEAETSFEAEAETEVFSEAEAETSFETEAETEVFSETEAETSFETEAATDDTGSIELPAEQPESELSSDSSDDDDIDIFNSLDDSVINADSVEEYKASYEETSSDNTDASETTPDSTESGETPSSDQEEIALQDGVISDSGNIVLPDENTDDSDETVPSDAVTPEADTLTGTLVFRNTDNDAVIYQYPTDAESTVSFTAGEVTSLPAIQLPCNAALNSLSIQFVSSSDTAYDLSQADFTDGATKTLTFTDGTGTYTLNLALTKAAHDYDAATCQHLATCKNCGATTGDYAEHVSANNETCTKNATCQVCGAELEGTALGHDWELATCTTPKTCSRCGATEGNALGHDLHDDWETIEESSYSSHGYQERYCHRDDCDYTESRDLNIVGNPADNAIQNLSEGAVYDLKTRLTFSAYGAASENTSPIQNDVRYIPSTWSIQDTAGTWLDNYSGAFSISKPGTYTVTVTFQKQVYGDGSWQNTDIADSKSVTFSIGGASADGSDDAVRINPQTGDQTQILPFVIILAAAAIVIIVILVLRKKKKQ